MWWLFIPLFTALAADPGSSPIEQAQNLALKKNRSAACGLLSKALSDQPAAAKATRARWIEARTNLAKVFFTDKGQRAYEAGQSMMFENPEMAASQFKDALAFEEDNVLILTGQAKLFLAKQDCDSAAVALAKARVLNPLDSDAAVLELRTLLCQKNYEALKDKAKSLPPLDKWEENFVHFILAHESLHAETPKRAFESLTKVIEDQPQFPETYRLLAKAATELGKDNEVALQKYVSLCKGITVRERKRFSLEPRLCVHLKEVEDELSKKTTEN